MLTMRSFIVLLPVMASADGAVPEPATDVAETDAEVRYALPKGKSSDPMIGQRIEERNR